MFVGLQMECEMSVFCTWGGVFGFHGVRWKTIGEMNWKGLERKWSRSKRDIIQIFA
jgi:hypothetical protein